MCGSNIERLDQGIALRSYSRHTRKVYGREVKNFLVFSGKPVKELTEEDVRRYVLHLMGGNLSKETINTYQAAILFRGYAEQGHELPANAAFERGQVAA